MVEAPRNAPLHCTRRCDLFLTYLPGGRHLAYNLAGGIALHDDIRNIGKGRKSDAMVGVIGVDAPRAVELFGEEHAHHAVRQREAGQADERVGARFEGRV